METRAHHVIIGLFTLVVGAGALLFALWLGKSNLDSSYDNYEIVFHEAVTGLSNGSPVQFNGIKVGEVTRLRLDDADPSKVLATIRVAATDDPWIQDYFHGPRGRAAKQAAERLQEQR